MAQIKKKLKTSIKGTKNKSSKRKSKSIKSSVVKLKVSADTQKGKKTRKKVPEKDVVRSPAKKQKVKFKPGDHVVYPTHGVGFVQGIERETIDGHDLRLVVVTFDNERMILRIPTNKLEASGLREISSPKVMDAAISTLKGRARIKRTMWSRRAQEYELKINSGDPDSIAQVVRDLYRNVGQPDQSFSERQIYEMALERLAGEVAALDGTDVETATEKLEGILSQA
tara:strand:+ start:423 stop:1100 length:678 start_codon:yes stop_codon:yes gene_type:complete